MIFQKFSLEISPSEAKTVSGVPAATRIIISCRAPSGAEAEEVVRLSEPAELSETRIEHASRLLFLLSCVRIFLLAPRVTVEISCQTRVSERLRNLVFVLQKALRKLLEVLVILQIVQNHLVRLHLLLARRRDVVLDHFQQRGIILRRL